MKLPKGIISFEGVLEREPVKGSWHFVRFPHDVEELYGTRGRVRVKGTMNGHEIDRALIPRGDGTHYIVVSTEMRRMAGLRLGSRVRFALQPDEKPDEPELPEELSVALAMEPEARQAFELQTPGTRRGIAYWINSGKRPETRAQRTAEMIRRLLAGEFPRKA